MDVVTASLALGYSNIAWCKPHATAEHTFPGKLSYQLQDLVTWPDAWHDPCKFHFLSRSTVLGNCVTVNPEYKPDHVQAERESVGWFLYWSEPPCSPGSKDAPKLWRAALGLAGSFPLLKGICVPDWSEMHAEKIWTTFSQRGKCEQHASDCSQIICSIKQLCLLKQPLPSWMQQQCSRKKTCMRQARLC